MKLAYLGLLLASVVLADHWSACKNGNGRNNDATRACCDMQSKNSSLFHYDEDNHVCRDQRSFMNNTVDSGSFAKCCANKNLDTEIE